MARSSGRIITAVVAVHVLLLASCSDKPDTPASTSPFGPDLESSGGTWELEIVALDGEPVYYVRVRVRLRGDDEPKIDLTRSRSPGSLIFSNAMSSQDFITYWELAVAATNSRSNETRDCSDDLNRSESVFWYSGDDRERASITGCDDQIVEDFRALNAEFVEKYFNVELQFPEDTAPM